MTSNVTPIDCLICKRPLSYVGRDFAGKQIYQCGECEYVMTPPAANEQSAELYDNPEYFDGWGCNLEFNYDAFEPAVHRQAAEYLNFVQMHTQGKSLLDVGTGSGLFANLAKNAGYEVEGTDLSKHVSETLPAKAGFRVHRGTIEEIPFRRTYDVITMLHVLEHTTNPLSTLRRAREILNEEGCVIVVVPNFRSFDTRVKSLLSKFKLKSRPYKHLALGHHNWVFSIKSLKALGRAANLQVVHHRTTQPAWRAGAFHRLFNRFELASWCWIVYRKAA
ncbi:MAG TPA: class I SAM-dependent methyltransferase [Pyrinomonadaceae bacterium]|nr:class I SAM-dependent methyltransferase [Pyrinomonadaceae bacterium]